MEDGTADYRRFLDGDESAFDDLMKGLFRNLVFFIDRYVHDVHAAEDLAIDAFSDLIVNRRRYRFKASLKTYLFMIGRSRALDYLKHHKIIRFADFSEAEELSGEEEALAEIVLAEERKRVVHAAVAKLPEDMRTAVYLVYFEEMTYDEAARVMRIGRKRVDNLLYRAKKQLRAILGEEGRSLL